MNLENLGVQEMNVTEVKNVEGGWFIAFVAGAIIGGALYDVYKAGCKAVIAECGDGTYEGIPSCKR